MRKYSLEQYGRAVELRQAGASLSDIEAATGIAAASCSWHFRRLGVRLDAASVGRLRHKLAPEIVADIALRRRAGESAKGIATALGLPVKAVYRHALGAGVLLTEEQRYANNYAKRKTKHDYSSLVEARRAGASIAELSATSGVPAQTLSKELPRRGGRVVKRRTWEEFKVAVLGLGMSCPGTPESGQMSAAPQLLTCHCGRNFTAQRPYDLFYGRLVSCGCMKSREQAEVAEYVKSLGFEIVSDTFLLGKDGARSQQVDIYVPSLHLGIEYHGLYSHSEEARGRDYHLGKWERAAASRMRLVQIFSSEWLERRPIVEAYLASILGVPGDRVGARELEVIPVPWGPASEFLESNHLQGASLSGHFVRGLSRDGTLLALLVCRQNGARWELVRFCVKSGFGVVGGFARLWAHFLREAAPIEVVTFSDRRWYKGDLYARHGFSYDGGCPPSYWYFKKNSKGPLHHKSRFRKARIEKSLGPLLSGETEAEAMYRFGYSRIFDAGLDRWTWRSASTIPQ